MRIGFKFLLSFLFVGCSWRSPVLSQKVVLDVDGKQMTAGEFSQQLAYHLKDQDALSAKDPKTVAMAKAQIAQDFVVLALSERWAKEHSLILKAEDLDAEVSKIQKDYPDDLAFKQALSEDGSSFKVWRERLRDSMVEKMVSHAVVTTVPPPTDSEMQAYYNEHRQQFAVRETAQIRQILLATEADANEMMEQLKHGKKMPDLAKKFSISPEGPSGGNVGWLEKGVSDVFETAFRMKLGARSPVIKSAFGFHIFELTGRKPARAKTYSEAKAEIKRILMEKREQSLYLAWLEEQTRKSRVYKDTEFIDALKVETKEQ